MELKISRIMMFMVVMPVVLGKTYDGLRYADVCLLGRDRRELLSNILHETHLAIS